MEAGVMDRERTHLFNVCILCGSAFWLTLMLLAVVFSGITYTLPLFVFAWWQWWTGVRIVLRAMQERSGLEKITVALSLSNATLYEICSSTRDLEHATRHVAVAIH